MRQKSYIFGSSNYSLQDVALGLQNLFFWSFWWCYFFLFFFYQIIRLPQYNLSQQAQHMIDLLDLSFNNIYKFSDWLLFVSWCIDLSGNKIQTILGEWFISQINNYIWKNFDYLLALLQTLQKMFIIGNSFEKINWYADSLVLTKGSWFHLKLNKELQQSCYCVLADFCGLNVVLGHMVD